ncbi:MAG: glycoside hydrolase family 3 protein [Candidatus Krumholzibacteriota bacterium]|nr:glycoside hydrolase family 3 protein [Candidatus Krumholzibacteriota bacterium]
MDIDRLLERLSAHLVVGLAATELTDGERDLLGRLAPAGVIIFARNVENAAQLGRLTNEVSEIIRSSARLSPIIMADHEGGRISVLAKALGTPPSQMAAWGQGDRSIFEVQLRETAGRILSAGVNMVAAPVADINSECLNPVIGTRAFAESGPETTLAVAEAVRILSEEGLLTSLKHFPGHGSSSGDSHVILPMLKKSIAGLKKDDLIPFIAGIEAGADSVMMAHLLPAGGELPASLDPGIINGVLRREIGFDGVIITDGLEMAGALTGRGVTAIPTGPTDERRGCSALKKGSEIAGPTHTRTRKPAEVARSALEAGNDILLFTRPAEEVYSELRDRLPILIKDEEFWEGTFPEISSESRKRIIAMKERIAPNRRKYPGAEWNDEVYSIVAEKSVTILRDERNLLPFGAGIPVEPVFCGEIKDFEYFPVIEFVSVLSKVFGAAGEPGRDEFIPCAGRSIDRTREPVELYRYLPLPASSDSEKVLVLLNRRPLLPENLAGLTREYSVIVLGERPWDARSIPSGKTVIACMGTTGDTAKTAGRLLIGRG